MTKILTSASYKTKGRTRRGKEFHGTPRKKGSTPPGDKRNVVRP